MTSENFQGKQFRGARTRSGKLISNRKGGYERSRHEDYWYWFTRRKLVERALECAEREEEEHVVLDATHPVCEFTGADKPVGGGVVFESVDDYFGDFNENMVALCYGANGKLLSAHYVTPEDAMEMHRAIRA
jgi:hypothetical protein